MKLKLPTPQEATLVVVVAPNTGLPQGATLRIPLRTTKAVKSEVTEWTFTSTRPGSDSGVELPLTAPCAGLDLKEPLGTVQGEGEHLTVNGTCADKAVEAIDLSVSGPIASGHVYKGKIKVGESDVELTVEDKLSAALAALIIFFGIIIALAIGYFQGSRRPAMELTSQIRIVEAFVSPHNPENVEKAFAEAAAKLDLPQEVRRWSIAGSARGELATLRKALRGSPSEEVLKATRETLLKLELELHEWPKVANRLGELKLRGPRLAILPHYYGPILDRTLSRSGRFDLDAMRDVKAAADEAVTLANDWPHNQIEAAQALAASLPDDVPVPASFAVVLSRFDAATNIKDAEAALKQFWKANKDLREAAQIGRVTRGAIAAAGASAAGDEVFEPVETGDPAKAAAALAHDIFAIDFIVMTVLLAVALLAGMQLLWVGQSFGTCWDLVNDAGLRGRGASPLSLFRWRAAWLAPRGIAEKVKAVRRGTRPLSRPPRGFSSQDGC